jgi:hypothetical protein
MVAQADTGTATDWRENAKAFDGKLTEAQSKDLGFADRMVAADPKIEEFSGELIKRTEQTKNAIPVIGNSLISEGYQRGRGAGGEWLAAALRKDTGAAVTDSEWELYGPLYIPQPGDYPGTLADKKERRERTARAIKKGLGLAEVLAEELVAERAAKSTTAQPAATDDWRTQDPSTWTDEQLKEFTQ